jgi:hypothetical protein
LLAEGRETSGVEIHAYCLMTNHYHLLVRCPAGGLSAFMHRLGSMYTKHVNRRLGRDGPLFRGRFRSLVVDSPEYLHVAGRYIHRNPLDVPMCRDIDRYRWSSLRYYVTPASPPAWLTTSTLLDAHGSAAAYRSFVHSDEPHAPTAVGWAIDVVLAESDDVGCPHLRRTVAIAMLDQADVATAVEIERLLEFPTPTARRMAESRARRRLLEQPDLATLARAALRLVA